MDSLSVEIVLPNFMICGVQKGGTTALYWLLRKHPDIGMSPVKEIHFFTKDENYRKGLVWYSQFFHSIRQKQLRGEATPHYYCSQKARERIVRDIPDAKCIFILRDPVDRAYSNFWHYKRYGHEVHRDFLKAIESDFGYVDRSLYWKHLRGWFAKVRRDRLFVMLYEDFKNNPREALMPLWNFLQVPPLSEEVLGTTGYINVGETPRLEIVSWIHYLYARSHKIFPLSFRTFLKQYIKPLLYRKGYPPLSAEIRSLLIERYFRDDIERLQELLQRDLSCWLKVE